MPPAPLGWYYTQNYVPGILISGGANTRGGDDTNHDTMISVEVYRPGTNYHCELPSLPVMRFGHTSDGMTLCGADDGIATCIRFSSGKWVLSHALTEERWYHTSWYIKEEGKIILMGGHDSGRTTETIREGEKDAPGVPGFALKYNTR